MMLVPPPAPPPPPAKKMISFKPAPALPPMATTVAPAPVLRVSGTPTISFPVAHKIIASIPSHAPAEQFVQDTVAAARGGNPEAQGNAAVLGLAARLQVQAKYVRKWFGDQAAQEILSGLHLARL